MGTGVRDKYNVAINSKGYMLKRAPGAPLYDKRVVPSQVDRLAISDIQYSDFSGANLFYIAQTDWSAGLKDTKRWLDDGKYYYSNNIDTYSEPGAIKLLKNVAQVGSDFSAGAQCVCATFAEVNSASNLYVGTTAATSPTKPLIYKLASGTLTDIASFTSTDIAAISQLIGHKNKLWDGNVAINDNETVQSYNGSSWTDHSAAVITAATLTTLTGCRAFAEIAGTLYFGIDDTGNALVSVMSTADNGSTFTEEVSLTTDAIIVAMVGFLGKLYYLLENTNYMELRVFDPADSSDATVRTFYNASSPNQGVGDKLLRVFQGKLIITIPNNSIFEYDGTSLTRIFDRITDRQSGLLTVSITYGAIEKDNKLFWYNLVYDGEVFYNNKRPVGENAGIVLNPIAVDSSDIMYYWDASSSTTLQRLYSDSSTVYKTKITSDGNLLVFNGMDAITSIDKLLDSITIIYDTLATGTSIEVFYSIDDMTTWTSIGSVTAAGDANTTKRTFSPTSAIKYNKIWIKVEMDTSTNTNTPVLRDLIVAYKPFPDYKVRWSVMLDGASQVGLLNRQNDERSSNEINSELWNLMNLKQKVTFEDIDYNQCSLVSAMAAADTSAKIQTNDPLPRSGRLRAVTSGYVEEMYYTSANNSTVWGITRAARGTKARAYASGVVLKNDYDVYIESLDTKIDVTDENKTESRIQAVLIEA